MTEYPIWQQKQVCFWTDKSNFDPVRDMLREKYGLVQARDSQLTPELEIHYEEGRKLVYDDPETGQGIYRVDFRERGKNSSQWPNDLISFGYWNLDKRPPCFREKDPMKDPLIDAYRILHPEHVTLGFEIGDPVNLAELLGI